MAHPPNFFLCPAGVRPPQIFADLAGVYKCIFQSQGVGRLLHDCYVATMEGLSFRGIVAEAASVATVMAT